MKYFRQFLKQHRGKTILALLLLLGQVVGTLLIPALVAQIIDYGILQGDMDIIVKIGVQMLLVAALATVISALGAWATSNLGSLFGREMRSKLFGRVQELSIQQFDEIGVSSLITRSTSDITNLQQALGMILQMVVPAPLIVAVSIIMTWIISPVVALIQIGFMTALIIISAIMLKKSNSLSHSIQKRLDRINKVLREAISGARVIRAFGNESYEEKRSGLAYEEYANNMIRLNRLFAIFAPVVWLLMGGIMVVALGVGGVLTLGGTMAVGEITAVIEYATLTMGYLMMAVASLVILPKALACLERLEDVLDTEPAITEMKFLPIGNQTEKENTAVEFSNVTFAYPEAEEAVLQNISFTMQQGETTAVIGSTGSGKSTLIDLLLRLHDVQSGTIKLGQDNIRHISQHDLRERIGCVPQKAFLFSGTIAENLRMGREDAMDNQLWEALKIAQAKDFVEKLPLGLNAPVSQGGKNFSGGQKQRLSIARALLKNPDVLVFDDSFSALDVKTDAALREELRHSVSSPAKLIIAQRVSSIMDADQILVLNDGKLVGVGTHNMLMESCDVYRAIAESQMNRKEA